MDVDDQVGVAVVHRLERRAGFNVDDPSRSLLHALRRFAEVHRQRPLEDDERLILRRMAVSAARRARLVAPDVRANVAEVGRLAQFGHVPCRFARRVRPSDPADLLRVESAVRHRFSVIGQSPSDVPVLSPPSAGADCLSANPSGVRVGGVTAPMSAFASPESCRRSRPATERSTRSRGEKLTVVSLRVTSIYREGRSWKLLHRHADPITTVRPGDSVKPND